LIASPTARSAAFGGYKRRQNRQTDRRRKDRRHSYNRRNSCYRSTVLQ